MRPRLITALLLGFGLMAAGLGSGDALAQEKKKKKKAKPEQVGETMPAPAPKMMPKTASETGPNTGQTPPPPPVSCPGEFANDLRSHDSGVPTEITFVNGMPDAISVFWINYDGQAQHYATLPPGEQLVQGTFLMHPWLVISEPLPPPPPTEEDPGAGPNGDPDQKRKKAGKAGRKGKKAKADDAKGAAVQVAAGQSVDEQSPTDMPGPACIGVYFPDDRKRTIIIQ